MKNWSDEELLEEGEIRGQRKALLRVLESRFNTVPPRVVERIQDATDEQQLGSWLDAAGTARKLSDIPFDAREPYEEYAEMICATVRPSRRAEVREMGKTIAEALEEKGREQGREEGQLEARREILLRQLRLRFKRVPARIVTKIQATEERERLDTWLDGFATAHKLSDIPFDLTD